MDNICLLNNYRSIPRLAICNILCLIHNQIYVSIRLDLHVVVYVLMDIFIIFGIWHVNDAFHNQPC